MTDLRTALDDIAADVAPLGDVRPRLRSPGRRWAPVAAAAGVVVVGLGAAAVLFVTGDRTAPTAGPAPATAAPTDPWGAVCFGEPDLSTEQHADQAMGQKSGAATTSPRPEDWFDICAAHWPGGTFTMDSVINADGSVPTAPPGLHLVACVLPDGRYGIFRGPTFTCSGLGLPLAVAPDPSVGVIGPDDPTG